MVGVGVHDASGGASNAVVATEGSETAATVMTVDG